MFDTIRFLAIRPIAIFLAVLLTPLAANATLIFEIERISDTTANITATGTLDGPAPAVGTGHIIAFLDPFILGPTGAQNGYALGSSTMLIGTVPVDLAADLGPDYAFSGGNPWLYLAKSSGTPEFSAGSSVTGLVEVVLPSGRTFASVGSTGTVNWGLWADGIQAGSWSIVAASVPEPATLAIFGLGLAGLGLMRRRKRVAA